MKSVSLVLGSGGARGLAHIGVIRWLEENNIRIASISGCSIGALVGGIYAADKLDDFEQWVKALDRMDIINLMDVAWSRSGLVKGDRIVNTLIDLVGERTIESLPIKYTAVAADIQNEKEVWINSGSLFSAIRASISLPLLFTPYELNGTKLIDGGVLNPVPIAPTFSDNSDYILAVNLGGDIAFAEAVNPPLAERKPMPTSLHEKVLHYISQFNLLPDEQETFDWGAHEIANQAFDAMQGTIARQKLAAYPPDLSIEIARNACGMLDFHRAEEMIELGYRKAQDMLPVVADDRA